MAKSSNSVGRAARKLLVVVVIAVVSVAGLALIAGGGYMLLSAQGDTNLPAPISYVLAEETSPTAGTVVATSVATQATAATTTSTVPQAPDIAATAAAMAATAVAPSATPPVAWPTVPAGTALVDAQAATATATRIARPTIVITPVASAVPSGSTNGQLPDTGFGEFLQPLAGFGLAGVALTAHLIRRRR